MGRIFCVMGKSASGKDSIYKRLIKDAQIKLNTIITYTTRPIRSGEVNGVEYFFSTEEDLKRAERAGCVIESRTYQTMNGPWSYYTVDDGQIDLGSHNYLLIGTPESFRKMREYFGSESVIPIYIYVEDGERLSRALARERIQKNPKYAEVCRRFLADCEDFSDEVLDGLGIKMEYRFENREVEECYQKIWERINKEAALYGGS